MFFSQSNKKAKDNSDQKLNFENQIHELESQRNDLQEYVKK
jgi:hypothetical protein